MCSAGENSELEALRKLLTSWQVAILFEFFKDEDIGINELKMMDCSHIHSLLKDFKMGVRIRFEFNFKQWRQKLGIPLKAIEVNNPYTSICCCNSSKSLGRETVENHTIETTSMETNQTNAVFDNEAKRRRFDFNVQTTNRETQTENQIPSSPQSFHSSTSLLNILNTEDTFNLIPHSESTDDKNCTTNTTDIDNLPLKALGELLSGGENNEPPKFPSKNTPDKSSVNLKTILDASGLRGSSIVKFYQEKNRFTNVHRAQLIQIVVDYFIENDFHLSLNLSHNLEWEILKTFPTEKLEYYRTEKRGKIYAKFSNMKRYKRERNQKATTEVEMHNLISTRQMRYGTNEEEINNSVQTNDDNWYPMPEPEIVVKTENLLEVDENE